MHSTKITTIRVSKDVRDHLAEKGKKGDSFDTILREMLKKPEQKN